MITIVSTLSGIIRTYLTKRTQIGFLFPLKRKMKNHKVVITKQKMDTNITQPRGLLGMTRTDAARIQTKPPRTCRVMQRRVGGETGEVKQKVTLK